MFKFALVAIEVGAAGYVLYKWRALNLLMQIVWMAILIMGLVVTAREFLEGLQYFAMLIPNGWVSYLQSYGAYIKWQGSIPISEPILGAIVFLAFILAIPITIRLLHPETLTPLQRGMLWMMFAVSIFGIIGAIINIYSNSGNSSQLSLPECGMDPTRGPFCCRVGTYAGFKDGKGWCYPRPN